MMLTGVETHLLMVGTEIEGEKEKYNIIRNGESFSLYLQRRIVVLILAIILLITCTQYIMVGVKVLK